VTGLILIGCNVVLVLSFPERDKKFLLYCFGVQPVGIGGSVVAVSWPLVPHVPTLRMRGARPQLPQM